MNNKMVFKKKNRYYITNITKPSEWSRMTTKQKERCIGKDVTLEIKRLLKKHGSKANMNFKTKPSKKKIRNKLTKRKGVKGG